MAKERGCLYLFGVSCSHPAHVIIYSEIISFLAQTLRDPSTERRHVFILKSVIIKKEHTANKIIKLSNRLLKILNG